VILPSNRALLIDSSSSVLRAQHNVQIADWISD
jgi:hypothetical protein